MPLHLTRYSERKGIIMNTIESIDEPFITEGELAKAKKLLKKLEKYKHNNLVRDKYYRGVSKPKTWDIALGKNTYDQATQLAWASLAVDPLVEKVSLDSFGVEELEDILSENNFASQQEAVITDSFKYGVGYLFVSHGLVEEGEPRVLITAESPMNVCGHYDSRKKRTTYAIKKTLTSNNTPLVTLFTDNTVVTFTLSGSDVQVIERSNNPLGVCPVFSFFNKFDPSRENGRSEITDSIMANVDRAQRTLVQGEINREAYAQPFRYLLGANANDFRDADGNPYNPLNLMMGQVMVTTASQNAQGAPLPTPTIGQLTPNSPEPFTKLVEHYANLLAAEACVPIDRLGFTTVNPSSGDAIRAAESALVAKAQARIRAFTQTWEQVGNLLVSMFGIDTSVQVMWKDPERTSRASDADAVIKLLSAGVFTADDDIIYSRYLGLSSSEIRKIRKRQEEESVKQESENV